MKITIIIPLYKELPSTNELSSFKQCYDILGKYNIYVITYKELNLSKYENAIGKTIKTCYFDKHYFTSINEYSNLMMSNSFYSVFRDYDYMLIYQTDAWVFQDKLEYWCLKNYDYIGAPWFNNKNINGINLKGVGNGGFSLRKISKFLYLTEPKTKLRNFTDILSDLKSIYDIPSCILHMFGYHNTIAYYSKINAGIAEDVYFCEYLSQFNQCKLSLPSEQEACYFAFEQYPSWTFNNITHTLPFGCHAWEKNEKNFWINNGLPQ